MKKYNFILLIFVFILFVSGSCEERKEQYYITIQNNSDKEIIFIGSVYFSIAQTPQCIKPVTKFEYENFIYRNMIKPYSSKKIGLDGVVKQMHTYPDIVKYWYLGIFHREDIDTMSCEEFKQKYPLKKEWKVTLEDILKAPDFNLVLVYTDEE